MMYEKPKEPKMVDKNNANGAANGARKSRSDFQLGDFELWLETQLADLEAKYESFATINSNRAFFDRDND